MHPETGSFIEQLPLIGMLPLGTNDGASPGEESGPGLTADAGAFEDRARETFTETSEEFTGAGTEMDSYQITIYDLITDPEIANADYMGKSKGVKVTIVLRNSLDTMQASLWGYEVDATRIAKEYFTGDLNDHIGFVAVVYTDKESGPAQATFKLVAADADRIGDRWDSGEYIKKTDWSETIIDPAAGITNYERPAAAITFATSPASNTSISASAPNFGKETLAEQISDSTSTLTLIIKNIAEKSDENNYREMAYLSDLLVEEARKSRETIALIPVSPDLEPVKEQFLNGLQNIQDAGSSYWFGATFTRSAEFKQGNAFFDSGLAEMNRALSALNVKTIESKTIDRPSDSPYPDALALNERYVYQDAGKNNDISVKVEKAELRGGYFIEEDGKKQHVTPGYGYKFLSVVVWVTHLGYRGSGSDLILTPATDDFTVISGGEEYTDVTPSVFMQSVGEPYTSVTLERKERKEGLLIFAVPESIRVEETYIRLDLGNGETPVWQLVRIGANTDAGEEATDLTGAGPQPTSSQATTTGSGAGAIEPLAPGEEYLFRPAGSARDIGLTFDSYEYRESYLLKEDDDIHRVSAGEGNTFIFASLGFSNQGYEGGQETWDVGIAPDDVTLTSKGMIIAARTPTGYVEGKDDADSWEMTATGQGTERHLVFRVPDTLDPADVFINIDLGGGETAVWMLE